jgi:hypothetical protein
MSEGKTERVTAEDVKEVVRRYAEQNVPGCACAAVSFRVGEIGAAVTETLLVLTTSSPEGAATRGR